MSEDYTVGYGRPPKATQFKKGQSGNREGSRKKKFNFADTEAQLLFEEMHTIHQNGKAVRANSVVSILKMLKALAFQGNLRAVEILLKRADARAAAIAKRGGKDPTAESADVLVDALRQTFLGKWHDEEDE